MSIRYVDRCPICGQGDVVVVKEKSNKNLLLICDDCESQWHNPENLLNGSEPLKEEKKDLEEDVKDEEIIAAGWDKYIKNMGV